MKFVNKNYYEILDIDPQASEEDVKRAYRMVRSTWTPDSIAIYSLYTPDESEAISHKIEEAYQILSHPERRASYDRYLHHVEKLPPKLSNPQDLWQLLHGYEPPSDEHELLEDVTDLLADPGLEAEELAEEVVLEATGGDGRGIERLMADERSGFDEPEAIPDRPGVDRSRSQARAPALATSGSPARGSAAVRTTGSRPAVQREKGDFPAAPAAPPIKGAGRRSEPDEPEAWSRAPQTGGSPDPRSRASQTGSSAPDPRSRASQTGSSAPDPRSRASQTGSSAPDPRSRVPQFNSSPPDPRQPVSSGWSRSYASALKPTRPLPDRPISPQMLADCEAEHGLGGTFLRLIREYKGISIDDIAERTKIQHMYLRYLEEENFSELPAAVYIEGFVSQVARLLKLDIKRVVEGYMARYESTDRTEPDDL